MKSMLFYEICYFNMSKKKTDLTYFLKIIVYIYHHSPGKEPALEVVTFNMILIFARKYLFWELI